MNKEIEKALKEWGANDINELSFKLKESIMKGLGYWSQEAIKIPKYDYICKDCKNAFEVTQLITDKKLTECPKCNGEVRRLISKNINASFKGDGFYVNSQE